MLVPPAARQGIVVFARGSGSSRLSPRNRLVAERLQRSGLGTLLFDLLQPEEVVELNEEALAQLTCEKPLAIVPGAGHAGSSRDFGPRLVRASAASRRLSPCNPKS